MDTETKDALIDAYQAQVKDIYKVFANSVITAKGDANQIADAQSKFQSAIKLAADIKAKALSLA